MLRKLAMHAMHLLKQCLGHPLMESLPPLLLLTCPCPHPPVPFPAACFIAYVFIKRRRPSAAAGHSTQKPVQHQMQNGNLMLKDDDYAVQPASGRGGGGMVPVSATAMVGGRDSCPGAVPRAMLCRAPVSCLACTECANLTALMFAAAAATAPPRLTALPLCVCVCACVYVCVQASPAQYPLHDVRVHDEEDEDDTPMPMPITADESNLFQVGLGGLPAVGTATLSCVTVGACQADAGRPACVLTACAIPAPWISSATPLQLGSRLPPGQELKMQQALATAAQRRQLESTPEEGTSEAGAAAAAAAGAAAGVAAGGGLGGMLRKLSSKKGAKEGAGEAAAAAAAAAATQGEAPSNQLTPRPSTDSDAPQQPPQQQQGMAMPSPRPRGSMELLPEDVPDVVMVTPAGGGPPVPMVPLSMPDNVQASGRWRGKAACVSLVRGKWPAGTPPILMAAPAAVASLLTLVAQDPGLAYQLGMQAGVAAALKAASVSGSPPKQPAPQRDNSVSWPTVASVQTASSLSASVLYPLLQHHPSLFLLLVGLHCCRAPPAAPAA